MPLKLLPPPLVVTHRMAFEGESIFYGFKHLADGRYYNIFSKKTSETHPLKMMLHIVFFYNIWLSIYVAGSNKYC
jgi:hypothetical protein